MTVPPETPRTLPRYWNDETIKEGVVETAIPGDGPLVQIVREVPMSEDNERLPLRGNRWYPTMVRVSWGDFRPDSSEEATHLLMAEDARTIGKALIQAADYAEDADKPDTDPCGHWHPCDCRSKPVGEDLEG